MILCILLLRAISVHAILSVLIRRALEVSLHEFRQSIDRLIPALPRHLLIRQSCAAEQIHGMQQSPLSEQVIESLAGEHLHSGAQCTALHAYRLGERLAGGAGGAGEVGDEVAEDGDLDVFFSCVKVKLRNRNNRIHN